MDSSTALNQLSEAADLLRMVEGLMAVQRDDRSEGVLAGMRITLKNVREGILESHDILARDVIARARAEGMGARPSNPPVARPTTQDGTGAPTAQPRRDLRASIEKGVS